MLLQRLNKNDLPEIIAFNRRCFSPGDRWSEEDWTELLEDELAHYYALLENGQIVGNMFLYDWQGERDFLKIMNLGVAPDRRGQGLACRLLQKAAEELRLPAEQNGRKLLRKPDRKRLQVCAAAGGAGVKSNNAPRHRQSINRRRAYRLALGL